MRPTPIGVVSTLAFGERGLGRRESIYFGLDLGRLYVHKYDGAAAGAAAAAAAPSPVGSALPVLRRLTQVAVGGATVVATGGRPVSAETVLTETEKDAGWLRARAVQHAASGRILVHEETEGVRKVIDRFW